MCNIYCLSVSVYIVLGKKRIHVAIRIRCEARPWRVLVHEQAWCNRAPVFHVYTAMSISTSYYFLDNWVAVHRDWWVIATHHRGVHRIGHLGWEILFVREVCYYWLPEIASFLGGRRFTCILNHAHGLLDYLTIWLIFLKDLLGLPRRLL